jgi:adenine-specific DNA-methyltransferase
MPKKKPTSDTSNIKPIDNYAYPEFDRANNPLVGLAPYDIVASPDATYEYNPHIDPSLQWAGKAEGTPFEVPTTSIHIHEKITPQNIIHAVQTLGDDYVEIQGNLFESDLERAKKQNEEMKFYQHRNKWTNRLIAGDSLVIMNSMLKKEGMAGQVQMVYIDPPYGIRYGSNFQPFVNKRDVKDKKDEDLNTEPEMIKAFRDTWELGIHSYLTYLLDRLLLAKELLSDTGSVFVQIGEDNVHHVREICDEIFECGNLISLISFRTSTPLSSNFLSRSCDYIMWYAKDKNKAKYRQLFENKQVGAGTNYMWIEEPNGIRRRMTKEESEKPFLLKGKIFYPSDFASSGYTDSCFYDFEFNGKSIKPGKKSWRTHKEGVKELIRKNRIMLLGNNDRPCYILYHSDNPLQEISNFWTDTRSALDKKYVVETDTATISRCLLMTTDPGDLVLDITCGSGTTAYVAEQWGRRWITCDTSRIAITLAKKRLMTATFDYYKLAHPELGVKGGFIYKTVPHITLKSIANSEPPEQETLYDQPEIEKRKIRITGPFTVEALPAPIVMPFNNEESGPVPFFYENAAKKQHDWMHELLASGIQLPQGKKLEFSRVEPLQGTTYLHGEAETKEQDRKRAVICFAGETRPLDIRIVMQALKEAEKQRPLPSYIIFAAFQFDPAASEHIDSTNWPGFTLLKANMNPDLMTADLKKKSVYSQSFWLVGQPDVELIRIEEGKYKVKINGFDYYNIHKKTVESGNASKIAMWYIDTDYDGNCVNPVQVFFPMDGKGEGWDKLAKALKAEINQDLIEKYHGTESLPFTAKDNSSIAVKLIDDRGIESLKVFKIGTVKNG